ncbi:MAG: hypothetical protein U0746_20045 [Gemmataceae bacterium]
MSRLSLLLLALAFPAVAADAPLDIGSRRELFVDRYLIDRLDGASLELQRPVDRGPVLTFDKPWEGLFSGYCTILHEPSGFRAYYRGSPAAGKDGNDRETTCVAESVDGVRWTKPTLGLFEVDGTRDNNVILAGMAPASHNFSPMVDGRPGVPAEERYKALGGIMSSGLFAFGSADGLRWRKLRAEPVLTKGQVPFRYMFDSQNVAFWSEAERCYVCYFRVFQDNIRRIARTTSQDFLTWTPPVLMEYRHPDGPAPIEHLYTNQTHPYTRAPHLYVAVAARFFPGRQVLSDSQARALKVSPNYFKDTSDAVFLTTRGGATYDRTYLDGFLRPGVGPQNWVSRTNYPALNVVETGPAEMSLYVNQDYAQPTAHLHRYSLRLDGFAAVRASYRGGEVVTKPLTFSGRRLLLNFATSAAGGVRVEIQNAEGQPLPGFTLADSRESIGNEIERAATWKDGDNVSRLAGTPVRLRFVLKDADLFALRFGD